MRQDFPTDAFRAALLDWFAREGKTYPWRETTDPWFILVSEVMLQQTTIPTVLARYDSWMARFPTPRDLAEADEETALRSWEGLGYYRRVRSLQAIARAVEEKHGGVFPDDAERLMALPGIGEYTCGALLSFAFNIPAPIVDTNVSRVIARLDDYRELIDSPQGKKYMWSRARQLVDPMNARAFNSAIMELGQTYCKSKVADCLLCPVRRFCSATSPLDLPAKTPKTAGSTLTHYDIVYVENGCLLLARQTEGRHVGMYRFPERNKQTTEGLPLVLRQRYGITKYKVTRFLHRADERPAMRDNEILVPLEDLEGLPMASPDRKALHHKSLAPYLRPSK